MTQISDIVDEVYEAVEWQRMPRCLSASELSQRIYNIVIDSIRYLYVITGRSGAYDESKQYEEDESGTFIAYLPTLQALERVYIVERSIVGFLRKVQSDVNNIVGYSTDAMTITNADKPYQYLSQSIAEREAELRKLYYKMVNYTIL